MNNEKTYWYNPFIKTVYNDNTKEDYFLGFIPFGKKNIDYSFPVDIVFCWVDGNDVEWQKKKQKFQNNESKELNEQAIDNGRFVNNDELKFALRSIEKNLPWINKIFIVTDNQIPKWLNTANSKIKVIFHKDFIQNENLPLFNSEAIESYLNEIPNLSENFLYFNDDMYIYRQLDKSFFFMPDGKPIIRLRRQVPKRYIKTSMYARSVLKQQNWILKHFKKKIPYAPHHNADAYTKSSYSECIKYFENEFSKTKKHKFRQEGDIQRVIISYYIIAKNFGKFKYCSNIDTFFSIFERIKRKITKKYCADSITISMKNKNPYSRLKKTNPAMFCTNDGEGITNFDRERIKIFLEETFPEKSSFEI